MAAIDSNPTRWIAMVSVLLLIAACESTGVVRMDGDTYLVSEAGPTLGFSPPIRQTASVYRQANEFCSREAKQVETIKLDQQESDLSRPASATLQFHCVAKPAQ